LLFVPFVKEKLRLGGAYLLMIHYLIILRKIISNYEPVIDIPKGEGEYTLRISTPVTSIVKIEDDDD